MSPVNISVTDASGDVTGIVPIAGVPDFYLKEHDIPGSAAQVSGEEKFVTVPQGGGYSVSVTGYASGPTNIQITNRDERGSVVASTTIADIPVATSTEVTFSLGGDGTPSAMAVDLDGNGIADVTVTPRLGVLTSFAAAVNPAEYVDYVTTQIQGMNLGKGMILSLVAQFDVVKKLPTAASSKHGGAGHLMTKLKAKAAGAMLENLVFEVQNFATVASRLAFRPAGSKMCAVNGRCLSQENADQIIAMINELRTIALAYEK